MGQLKRCKLLGHVINPRTPPGTILNVWGHQFIVQSNLDAIAYIDEAFHKVEVAAGRYVVLEDEANDTKAYELTNMGTDIGNYFGAGSLEDFYQTIKKLRPEALRGFQKTRFNITLPQSMTKKQLLSEIMNMVAEKSKDQKPDDKLLQVQNVIDTEPSPVVAEVKKKRGRPRTKTVKK